LIAVHVAACSRAIVDAETKKNFTLVSFEDASYKLFHVIQCKPKALILGWSEGTIVVLWQEEVYARADLRKKIEVGFALRYISVHGSMRHDFLHPQFTLELFRNVLKKSRRFVRVKILIVDINTIEALGVHDVLELRNHIVHLVKAGLPAVIDIPIPASTHACTTKGKQDFHTFRLPPVYLVCTLPRADWHRRSYDAGWRALILARVPGVADRKRDYNLCVAFDLLHGWACEPVLHKCNHLLTTWTPSS